MKQEWKVSDDASGQRLDKFLRKRLESVPLSHLYKLVRTKKVRVNGARAQIDLLLAAGDVITVHGAREDKPPEVEHLPTQAQDFQVLYEDDAILVCNKPAGLAIHPGSGITGDTLVDQARAYLERQGLKIAEGEFKPSPAHRLDRDTSGVVVVSKTRQAMVRLTEIFTEGEAHKQYLTLAKGRFQKERGSIDLRLSEHQQTANSKEARGVNMQDALTHWKKLAGGPEATLLEVEIETGRTHQIRRHLAAIGHPVVGDSKYGDFPFNRQSARTLGLKRMFLHSLQLSLAHPLTKKQLVFRAPLPAELEEVLPKAGIKWSPRADISL